MTYHVDTATHQDPEAIVLASAVGEFLKYWGFKEIYGRIWIHVYLATGPITASQLVKELNVTKGLISMALAEMLEYGVLERIHLGNAKSPGYAVTSDLESVITKVLREREQRLLNRIHSSVVRLKEKNASDRDLLPKLKRLESMTALAVDSLNRLLSYRAVPTWKWRLLMKLAR